MGVCRSQLGSLLHIVVLAAALAWAHCERGSWTNAGLLPGHGDEMGPAGAQWAQMNGEDCPGLELELLRACPRQAAALRAQNSLGLQLGLRGGGGRGNDDAGDQNIDSNLKMDPTRRAEQILDRLEDLLREGGRDSEKGKDLGDEEQSDDEVVQEEEVWKMCQHDTELSKEIQADFVKYAMRAQDDSPGEGGSAANSTNEIVGLQAAVARWKHAEAQGDGNAELVMESVKEARAAARQLQAEAERLFYDRAEPMSFHTSDRRARRQTDQVHGSDEVIMDESSLRQEDSSLFSSNETHTIEGVTEGSEQAVDDHIGQKIADFKKYIARRRAKRDKEMAVCDRGWEEEEERRDQEDEWLEMLEGLRQWRRDACQNANELLT